jgi:spore germination cell wall hydrolase CwlJ-like protein
MWGLIAILALLFPFPNAATGQTQTLAAKVFGPFLQYGPPVPPQLISGSDLDTLARTLWGEARGDGKTGMQAVANVVMNRYRLAQQSVAYARQFGSTVAGVCRQPKQFSCWNSNDPNLPKMLAVGFSDQNFVDAVYIAQDALANRLPDLTNGATHYHTRGSTASWDTGQAVVASIGNHLFYDLS